MWYPGIAQAGGVIDDAIPLSQVMLNALSWLLSFLGLVAIATLVVVGVFYAFSAGDAARAEQAKRMAGFVVVGLALGLSALVIVRLLGNVIQ